MPFGAVWWLPKGKAMIFALHIPQTVTILQAVEE
jgi:hypothetical protein